MTKKLEVLKALGHHIVIGRISIRNVNGPIYRFNVLTEQLEYQRGGDHGDTWFANTWFASSLFLGGQTELEEYATKFIEQTGIYEY